MLDIIFIILYCLVHVTSNRDFPVRILKSSNVGSPSRGRYDYEEEGRGDETVEDQHYEDHHIVGLEILNILVQALGQSPGRRRDLQY